MNENIAYKVLELAEDFDGDLSSDYSAEDVLDALAEKSMYSIFTYREHLHDKLNKANGDIKLVNSIVNNLERTYSKCSNGLIVQIKDNLVVEPNATELKKIYNRFKFGCGLSLEKILSEIERFRKDNNKVADFLSNGSMFNYLDSFHKGAYPAKVALDIIKKDSINTLCHMNDYDTKALDRIKENTIIISNLANLIKEKPNYLVNISLCQNKTDMLYSEDDLIEIYNICKEIERGEIND